MRASLLMHHILLCLLCCPSLAMAGEREPLRSDHAAAAAEAVDSGAVPAAAPRFVASTAKSFAALMDDAMAVMDQGMRTAPMDGRPEHDFLSMMIPHHQGAIDMAEAVLLSTRDPELRNLAQSIITEQRNEIVLMQAWLARHRASATDTVAPESHMHHPVHP